MNKLMICIVFLFIALNVKAQSGYESILQQIEANNTTLIALRHQTLAQKIENRADSFLENPEVEFGHTWNLQEEVDNVMSFTITQSFDFPTAYIHHNKILNLENESAELSYKTQRAEILLLSKETCIELVYHNILAKEYSNRLEKATLTAEAFSTKLQKGETNILEYNKARLNLAFVRIEVAKIETQRTNLIAQLKQLNGGKEINFSHENYQSDKLPPDFEEWFVSLKNTSPDLLYLKRQIDSNKQQIKLDRALVLPKFSLSFIAERNRNESSEAVMVGFNIPLWENLNRVRVSQAQLRASEFAMRDIQIQLYSQLKSQYTKAISLQQHIREFRQALTEYNNESLLKRALDAGEISLLEYLQEIEYYYEIMNNMLETERDFELIVAQFWAAGL